MAGASASILLSCPISERIIDEICAVLRSISEVNERCQIDREEVVNFAVADTTAIGGCFGSRDLLVFDSIPMGMHWRRDRSPFWEVRDPSRYADRVHEVFAMRPVSELCFDAYVGCREAHQVLGELTLHLSQQLGGLISYADLLWPWWKELPQDDPRWQLRRWAGVKPHFEALIATMPGRIEEVRMEADAAYHIADADFARAWLGCASFHM
jgi:uncharacterized protein DUF6368